MSTLVDLPPDPIIIRTPYGKVPAAVYNRDLTLRDIAQIRCDMVLMSPADFMRTWNVRKFTLEPYDDSRPQCGLLDDAVEISDIDLVRFVYKHLSYDDKFYSLMRVQIASVKSAAMRDQLIKYTLQFGGDYDEDLKRIRRQLK
jgi:hypothetical protein